MPDEMDQIGQTLATLGSRLRAVRERRQSTLAQLSRASGISVSTLSRLESGGRKPTLELLLRLANAHEVRLEELISGPATPDPRLHPEPVHRHDRTVIALTRRPGGLQAYKMIIAPGESDGDLRSHEGYEWMYVLNGRLRLRLGELDLVLGAGEVAEFDTHTPHWFGSAGLRPVELLVLFGPQGERMHVRARPRRAPAR
ncbi:MAG: XRE family transcriptional regulator [Actinomycetota bacterium]|nr:XRE family transcriptional regulator [Actinomycetota bacterium]